MEWQSIAIEAMSSSLGYSVNRPVKPANSTSRLVSQRLTILSMAISDMQNWQSNSRRSESDPSSGRGFFELPISLPPYIELFAPGTLNELYKIYKKAAENWGVVAQKADQNYHELLWMKEKVDTAEKILAVATGVGVAVQGGKLIAKEGIEVCAKYLTKELLIFAAGYGATVGAAAAAKEAGVNPTVIDVGVRAALLLLLLRAASAATESSAPLDAKKFVESIDNPDKPLTELKVLTEPPTATSPSPTRANAPLKVPQGLTEAQFNEAASVIRAKTGHIEGEVVVQGSRAAGTAKATSDIDFAVRVSQEQFDARIKARFGTPNPGSAKFKTMQHAIETGKIQAGEAGLRGVRVDLEGKLGMEVDISVIRKGGPFDNPPFIPLPK